jgi:outer membrane usher protein FimD/PapC
VTFARVVVVLADACARNVSWFFSITVGLGLMAGSVSADVTSPGLRLDMNYSVKGLLERSEDVAGGYASALDSQFNTRIVSPLGRFVHTGTTRYDFTAARPAVQQVRLDTAWEYAGANDTLRYRAGDAVAGTGLAWASNYRYVGLQVRRNPATLGDAVRKTELDMASLRQFSRTDALGNHTVVTLPYYGGATLLAVGRSDFQGQAGYPRLNYASQSNDYSHEPAVSGSLRFGVAEAITAETHFESTAGLINSGGGVVSRLGRDALISVATAGSTYAGQHGAQVSASYQGKLGRIGYYIGSQRRSAGYYDVARAAEDNYDGLLLTASPRYLQSDGVGVAVPLPFLGSPLHVNYVRLTEATAGTQSQLVNVTHAHSFGGNVALYTSAYADVRQTGTFGFFLGVGFALGGVAARPTAGSMKFSTAGLGTAGRDTSGLRGVERATGTLGGSLSAGSDVGLSGSTSTQYSVYPRP